jgi:hypothetical protein
MATRNHRSRSTRATTVEDWLAGGIVAGGLALAVAGIVSLAGPRQRQRVVVGGVDLTNTDLTRPFVVDFSLPASCSLEQKREALQRLRTAMLAFEKQWPLWTLATNIFVPQGVFRLLVTPISQEFAAFLAAQANSARANPR